MKIPEITIQTSLIGGFPGETQKQFEGLLKFVEEYLIDNVGIFQYSKEPGSYGVSLSNQILDGVKSKRQKYLAKAQKKASRQLLNKRVAQTLEMVVEGYYPESPL